MRVCVSLSTNIHCCAPPPFSPFRLVGGLDVMRDMGDELADVLKDK